ncbi:kinesin [Drepanopeziza brunnea f. sp. 'multigermtubi' MB_m1]|uniref:Kinesin n=1 Tax=Marssonina brunnea f. sp. multigermtubi (strain MB_m1) TaxID=1072389 RepID=K1XA16_MARBU|nr:kinesin [Drepanopeziza brunnea f. sp. 'multigermtubi' MB_m1]EKD17558.1 kinesin [Drepanopeziza brunnea f. sp. 'multigermtubi' MB_m1]
MEYTEENARRSQLKQPSRIPHIGLAEISESQGNARAVSSKLAQPTLKHRLGGVYEPEPKRKTLAEKAGEFPKPSVAAPTVRPLVKTTSLAGAGSISTASAEKWSTKIHLPLITARRRGRRAYVQFIERLHWRLPRRLRLSHDIEHELNTVTVMQEFPSFSSSVGPNGRPKSSYAGGRSNFSQSTRAATVLPRSTTSMDVHSSEDDTSSHESRQGTKILTTIPSFVQSPQVHASLLMRKLRQPQPTQALRHAESSANIRDVSVSTALSRLCIDGEVKSKDMSEYQANSTRMRPPKRLGLGHKSSIRGLRIDSTENALMLFQPLEESSEAPVSPSHIPKLSRSDPFMDPVTPRRTPKPSPQKTPFLTKDSNVPGFTAWDVDDRVARMEGMVSGIFSEIEQRVSKTTLEKNAFEEAVTLFKARKLSSSNASLQGDLNEMRSKVDSLHQDLLAANASLSEQLRAHRIELDDANRESRITLDQMKREKTDEIDSLLRAHRDQMREMEHRATVEVDDKIREMERRNNSTLEEERSRRLREVQDLESRITSESLNLELELKKKDREIQNMRGELEDVKAELDREQALKDSAHGEVAIMKETLLKTGIESASAIHTLESTVASLRARIHFLESGSKAQSDSFVEMERRLQEALDSAEESKKKLIKEETLRRILFNQVQELKGNIRVMCRVRPVSSNGADEGSAAKITYPDVEKESKELEIIGKEERSSLGTITRKNHSFTFDRVFGPESQNQEVFEEISQLVQSALDGYNVCIFCYGQTGSGKTHTMSSADGMIPRATHQIYETATNLKGKGWTYTMEGSFVEVYNEEIHDLLGSSKDFDKKKHEIRHDDQKKQTTITGLKIVPLDSPNAVEALLKQADNNRSVAATKSNERSSRSHSVFILKLVGRNSTTNETSEGTLNLVDLAGSERLKQSGAEGDRMKETQNINKSLSCLGDVIGALGQGKEGAHIPYRNSKLTYLLQYSLGGNSKTLMFVMASPLEAHLSETLTSLKFATKVHNTHIGTAKKSTKVRERSSD